MAINILESDRIDRYEFEVFIGEVNFTNNYKSTPSEKAEKRSDITEKSRLKVNQMFSFREPRVQPLVPTKRSN